MPICTQQMLVGLNAPPEFVEAFEYPISRGLKLMQSPWEVLQFFNRIKELDFEPSTFLEIGNYDGVNAYILSRALPKDCNLYMMDIVDKPECAETVTELKRQGYIVKQIIGDSHDAKIKDLLLKLLPDDYKRIDILFIDGDHSYAGVRKDFETYYPWVQDGGIIGFHDIIKPETSKSNKEPVGVRTFWTELKKQYPNYKEYVKCPPHRGIGVITK
jgi:predicted O-methyltransferase YrrM